MGIDREAGECFYEAQGGFGKKDSSVFSRSAEAFHMQMDASGYVIGATLSQQDDSGDLCLVMCVRMKLNPA